MTAVTRSRVKQVNSDSCDKRERGEYATKCSAKAMRASYYGRFFDLLPVDHLLLMKEWDAVGREKMSDFNFVAENDLTPLFQIEQVGTT